MTNFTLIYWKDSDWFVGRLKERPDVFSQGETLEELEANIADAYQMMAESDEDIVPNHFQQKTITLEAV